MVRLDYQASRYNRLGTFPCVLSGTGEATARWGLGEIDVEGWGASSNTAKSAVNFARGDAA